MPCLTRCLLSIDVWKKSNFIDSLRVYARGGCGGNGLPRFGGIGGKGGDILVEAQENVTLFNIKKLYPSKRFIASSGGDSKRNRILGLAGTDVVIPCPVGITLLTDSNRVLGDLNKVGDKVLVAKGGIGGNPENSYLGQKGQIQMFKMDLKLLADVGFVGFPNAGKSTLLKALSRANPKIANYPFTTLRPQLGVAEYSDHRQITVADLPGLIEGAHRNVGMGHSFLKHIIRTKLLLFVVDISGFQLNIHSHFRTAFETIMLLNKELELYKDDVLEKPAILAVNKMDTDIEEKKLSELRTQLKEAVVNSRNIPEELRPEKLVQFEDIVPITANKAYNVSELKSKIRHFIDYYDEYRNVSQSYFKEDLVQFHKQSEILV